MDAPEPTRPNRLEHAAGWLLLASFGVVQTIALIDRRDYGLPNSVWLGVIQLTVMAVGFPAATLMIGQSRKNWIALESPHRQLLAVAFAIAGLGAALFAFYVANLVADIILGV